MSHLVLVNRDNISIGGKGDVDTGAQVEISNEEYAALIQASRFTDGTLTYIGVSPTSVVTRGLLDDDLSVLLADVDSDLYGSVQALIEDMVLETLAANGPGTLLGRSVRGTTAGNWTTTNYSGSGGGGGLASVLATSLVGNGSLSVTFTGTGRPVWLIFNAPLVNHSASATVNTYFVVNGVAAFEYAAVTMSNALNRTLPNRHLLDTVEGQAYTIQVGICASAAGTTGLTCVDTSAEVLLAVVST